MGQISSLIKTLKAELKASGKTYADVAQHLDLSDASVKRMFSNFSFSLERLEKICLMINLEISDLVKAMNDSQHLISHLTEEQEQELVANEKLLLLAVCARNYWSIDDITSYYDITTHECIALLAKLDKLKLIELLPGNRIKLLLKPDFRWLKDGPIEHHFRSHIQSEFFNNSFSGKNEFRLFLSGNLSDKSISHFIKTLNELAREFSELHADDKNTPINEKQNIGMLLAIRPWELSAFTRLRKEA